ncbi:hypothetical protein BO443_20196 [Burkholderia orbicola]
MAKIRSVPGGFNGPAEQNIWILNLSFV